MAMKLIMMDVVQCVLLKMGIFVQVDLCLELIRVRIVLLKESGLMEIRISVWLLVEMGLNMLMRNVMMEILILMMAVVQHVLLKMIIFAQEGRFLLRVLVQHVPLEKVQMEIKMLENLYEEMGLDFQMKNEMMAILSMMMVVALLVLLKMGMLVLTENMLVKIIE